MNSLNPHKTLWVGCYYAHFIDGEIEEWKYQGQVITCKWPSQAFNTTVLNISVLLILLDLLYLPSWTFFFFLDFTFFIIYDLLTFLRSRNSHFPILPSGKCTKEWNNLPKASWLLTLTVRSHSHPFFIALIVSISAKSFLKVILGNTWFTGLCSCACK